MAIDKVVDSTVLDGYFEDIADSIRLKNGSSDTYTPQQMSQAIEDIPAGGGDTFYDAYYTTGSSYSNSDIVSTPDNIFYNAKIGSISLPNCEILGGNSFRDCFYLTSINLPKVKIISTYVFDSVGTSNSVTEPFSIILPEATKLGARSIRNTKASVISVPKVESIGDYTFQNNKYLKNLTIPASFNGMWQQYVIDGDIALEKIVFEGNVISIPGYGLRTSIASVCLEYNFSHCTAVPNLINANAFQYINANAKIVVPDSLYEDWIIETNWSTLSSYIVKASEYVPPTT